MKTLSDKQINQYVNEIRETMEQMKKDAPPICELQYFWEIVEQYFSLSLQLQDKPNIIVWGTGIPEEIIYAFDRSPCLIAGGSLAASAQVDDVLPRDTDPVSRSSYGIVQNKLTEKSMVMIPIVNDSSKKISYLLKAKGVKVCTLDFPPADSSLSHSVRKHQMELCAEEIAGHLGKSFTKRNFQNACKLVYQAKTALQKFVALSGARTKWISDALRMFIIYSYSCSNNLAKWTEKLRQLNEKITGLEEDGETDKSNILLIGSPIYFPNYKVPFLLQEVGLHTLANIDYTTVQAVNPLRPGKKFSDVVNHYFANDCSGAYAKNDKLYRYVQKAIAYYKPDGIVFHILKGQIEYDYELSRMETMFYEKNIPVFRLETDYNKQDIEQLRIRAEAFSEVLQQRKLTEVNRK